MSEECRELFFLFVIRRLAKCIRASASSFSNLIGRVMGVWAVPEGDLRCILFSFCAISLRFYSPTQMLAWLSRALFVLKDYTMRSEIDGAILCEEQQDTMNLNNGHSPASNFTIIKLSSRFEGINIYGFDPKPFACLLLNERCWAFHALLPVQALPTVARFPTKPSTWWLWFSLIHPYLWINLSITRRRLCRVNHDLIDCRRAIILCCFPLQINFFVGSISGCVRNRGIMNAFMPQECSGMHEMPETLHWCWARWS